MANLLKQTTNIMGKHKKWVAMLAYSGNGYYGMQRQIVNNQIIEHLPTIESVLFDAFRDTELINEEEYKNPQLMRFQRAARTDKGVSAIKQIISMNISTDFPSLLPKINEILPPHIRVFGAKRATKYFDSKNFCDARTYSYLLPTFTLCPVEETTIEDFRIKQETLDEFNALLKLYLGTHNFHNFTAQKKPTDSSARRYIMSFECSGPFLMGSPDAGDDRKLEFVVARIKGQSFMLHQIRKMLGITFAIMRGFVDKSFIQRAFGEERLDVPMAPGLGLLLEEVHYEKYNKKFGGDGHHEALVWDECNEQVHEFKNTHIYPHIAKVELQEKSMMNWLKILPIHTYDVREPGFKTPQALRDTEMKPEEEPISEETEVVSEQNPEPEPSLKRDLEEDDAFGVEKKIKV